MVMKTPKVQCDISVLESDASSTISKPNVNSLYINILLYYWWWNVGVLLFTILYPQLILVLLSIILVGASGPF